MQTIDSPRESSLIPRESSLSPRESDGKRMMDDPHDEGNIDFIYSEEEEEEEEGYYCSGDDIDEDDRDKGDVENIEEYISDVALKYSMKLIPEDSSKPFLGWQTDDLAYTCRAEDQDKPALQDGTHRDKPALQDGALRLSGEHFPPRVTFSSPLRRLDGSWPPVRDWVQSWKVINYRASFAWIHVYAYHSKDKRFGGFGVIVRDLDAKPVTAVTEFSTQGRSFFTQVLLGIKAGVDLAHKHGLSKLKVKCNSLMVPDLVGRLLNCRNVKCRTTTDDSCICKWCLLYFSGIKGSDLSLVRCVREIKAKWQHPEDTLGCSKGDTNQAAYYLAKMGIRELGVQTRLARAQRISIQKDIQPDDFPRELRRILWEDAFVRTERTGMLHACLFS